MFVLGLAALENFLQSGNWVAIGCPAQWINFLGFVIVENEKEDILWIWRNRVRLNPYELWNVGTNLFWGKSEQSSHN